MRPLTLLATAALLVLSAASAAAAQPVEAGAAEPTPVPETVGDDDGRGTPYRVDKDDNICGLDEPRQLTNPAKVDYEDLLDATPQIKKMKKEQIDPESAEGIQLRNAAAALVRKKCERVRANQRHCSVWKEIERRDGKSVADITTSVKKLIEDRLEI